MNENTTLSTTKQTAPAKNLVGLAKRISHHHAECLKSFGSALRHAYECGRLLNEAKSRSHGESTNAGSTRTSTSATGRPRCTSGFSRTGRC